MFLLRSDVRNIFSFRLINGDVKTAEEIEKKRKFREKFAALFRFDSVRLCSCVKSIENKWKIHFDAKAKSVGVREE